MENHHNFRSSETSPAAEPPPYDSSISSSPSSLSDDGEGSELSLHHSPPPIQYVTAVNRSVRIDPSPVYKTQFGATEHRVYGRAVEEHVTGVSSSETRRKRPMHHNFRSSETSPAAEPPPYDSSKSSSPSSLSHHGEGSKHSLHPSPPPIQYVTAVIRSVRIDPLPVHKTQFGATEHRNYGGAVEGDVAGVSSSETRRKRPMSVQGKRSGEVIKKVNFGFRVFGFVFCLISFSVMAADRNKGWALDSFDRYIEFRYCLTVNVIGFLYSGLQGLIFAYQLSSGKLVSASRLKYFIDFASDQILAYLFMSSSSSAATRVEDWKSNWGKDKFPSMANASVAVSFMAFVCLASSSLISGYTICTL